MKRSLIKYDVLVNMNEGSVSNAGYELSAAEDILGVVLETELELVSYGTDNVIYECEDGTFVKSHYKLENNKVVFENIEQLVVDEETQKSADREALSNMFEAIISGETEKASNLFEEYIGADDDLLEYKLQVQRTKGNGKRSPFRGKKRAGGSKAAREAWRTRKRNAKKLGASGKKRAERLADRAKAGLGPVKTKKGQRSRRVSVRVVENHLGHLHTLCENVNELITYKNINPTLKESQVQHDSVGNVTDIAIPDQRARNEAKLLSFNWKTTDTDVKVLRSDAQKLHENQDFCKSVVELKRFNSLSDFEQFENWVESIVGNHPSVLYLTQTELSKSIKESFETMNVNNYDDETCNFLSESILRNAFEAYVDRVYKVTSLAGKEIDKNTKDSYLEFKDIVDDFYNKLDESASVEMQMFVDLYEAIRNIHETAKEQGEREAQNEAAGHLENLTAIIQKKIQPDFDVAETAVSWLDGIVETNLASKGWSFKKPHTTVSGDHPDMKNKAGSSYTPSKDFSGDVGTSAPVSDGAYKLGKGVGDAEEMRHNSWGNVGKETYPSLDNPYVPNTYGDYTMKNGEGVDKNGEESFGQWGNGKTWPTLSNPHTPDAETPQSYKMNHGNEPDLVVDKS